MGISPEKRTKLLRLVLRPFTECIGSTYIDPKSEPESGYFYHSKKRIFYRAFITEIEYETVRCSRETKSFFKAAKADLYLIILLRPLKVLDGKLEIAAEIYDCTKVIDIPGVDEPVCPPAAHVCKFTTDKSGALLSDKNFWNPAGPGNVPLI